MQVLSQKEFHRNFFQWIFWFKGMCMLFMVMKHGGMTFNYLSPSVPVSPIIEVLSSFISPVGTSLFLSLASLKILTLSSEETIRKMKSQWKIYFSICALVFLERVFLQEHLKNFWSVFPVLTWLIVLWFVSLVYGIFGIRGVWGLGLLQFLWTFLFKKHFFNHLPYTEYLPLDYVGLSAFSALFGRWVLGQENHKKVYFLYSSGLGLIAYCFWYFSTEIPSNIYDIYIHDGVATDNWLGQFAILSFFVMSLAGMVLLSIKNILPRGKIFFWFGKNSLFIYLVHRLVLFKLYMPLRFMLQDMGLYSYSFNFFDYLVLALFIYYVARWLQKTFATILYSSEIKVI